MLDKSLTNGNAQWIMEGYLDYCLQTYLKRLIAFQEPLIVKLHAYGVSFAHSYLTDAK